MASRGGQGPRGFALEEEAAAQRLAGCDARGLLGLEHHLAQVPSVGFLLMRFSYLRRVLFELWFSAPFDGLSTHYAGRTVSDF